MTLAEAGEILAYWDDNPPAHLLLQAIARLLGWRPPADAARGSVAALAAAAPPGLGLARGGNLGMPPLLDAATLHERNRARGGKAAPLFNRGDSG